MNIKVSKSYQHPTPGPQSAPILTKWTVSKGIHTLFCCTYQTVSIRKIQVSEEKAFAYDSPLKEKYRKLWHPSRLSEWQWQGSETTSFQSPIWEQAEAPARGEQWLPGFCSMFGLTILKQSGFIFSHWKDKTPPDKNHFQSIQLTS